MLGKRQQGSGTCDGDKLRVERAPAARIKVKWNSGGEGWRGTAWYLDFEDDFHKILPLTSRSLYLMLLDRKK
jgi:hypothetical protein